MSVEFLTFDFEFVYKVFDDNRNVYLKKEVHHFYL